MYDLYFKVYPIGLSVLMDLATNWELFDVAWRPRNICVISHGWLSSYIKKILALVDQLAVEFELIVLLVNQVHSLWLVTTQIVVDYGV